MTKKVIMKKITKEELKDLFNKYNKLYFNGLLPKCKFHVFKGRGTYGFYLNKTNGIWIAYDVEWTEETLRECLVHEMIHHYLYTIEGHCGGLFKHNWRYRRQCRRIEKDYGIKIYLLGGNLEYIGQKKTTTLYGKFRKKLNEYIMRFLYLF